MVMLMISCQIKLRTSVAQDKILTEWLWYLTGAWNTAIKRIGQDAKGGIYYSEFDMMGQVAGHSERIGIPSHTLRAIFAEAQTAWSRCFKKISKAPRLKSARRPLNSISFPDPIKSPAGNRITLPLLGKLRFHKQDIPKGKIKCGRIIKRTSGWYLCLFIDAFRAPIKRMNSGSVGMDPGFLTLLTLSTGERVKHPRELEASAKRLAQAQRGHNKHLAARIYERIRNQKKDRNHKLSLRLVRDFDHIYFSKDSARRIATKFGKSVASSNHSQLRQMLSYKSLAGGSEFVEVDPKFSTRTCSCCGALTGPAGLAGLKVRSWVCSGCGTHHDRDINAAINTLKTGSGRDHERAIMARQEAA
jgi:putative transposase